MPDDREKLKALLDRKAAQYDHPDFIASDPVSVPHQFVKKQDIEIAGFWTAILSWGLRKTIIRKAKELFALMGNTPHDFIVNHSERDRKPFLQFKHRTFQPTDTLCFLHFLQDFYRRHDSLEAAFLHGMATENPEIEDALKGFHRQFFSADWAPSRTRKHISTPAKNASCKRLNMFLRWMVRPGDAGVDFGLWKQINPSMLIIPLDLHVHRVATRLGLLHRKQSDWKAALELTEELRKFDAQDPVKYDFALFGMGVLEKHQIPNTK